MDTVSPGVPVCIFHHQNHQIQHVNQAFLDLLGYDESIIGQDFLMFIPAAEFSPVLQTISSLDDRPLYTSFPLLSQDGTPIRCSHCLVHTESTIIDSMIPDTREDQAQKERSLLYHLQKPVLCLDTHGNIVYANEAARQTIVGTASSLTDENPTWAQILSLLSTRKAFHKWIKIAHEEGFFSFQPFDDGLWIIEYQWGREEIVSRLGEILLTWPIPAVIIDTRQELARPALWNERFTTLGVPPLRLVEEIRTLSFSSPPLSISQPEGGFVYYRVLFLPLHPAIDITLALLLDVTDHMKKTYLTETLKDSLSRMIDLTETIKTRLSVGIEAWLEPYNLAPREKELVHYIQQGLSNEEIASKMFISVDTVKKSLSNLYKKLQVNNRLELLRLFSFTPPPKTPPKG